ncbi:MAG: choice-of-anchor J domain-containing protein, partial [Pseudomonadota bacterium]
MNIQWTTDDRNRLHRAGTRLAACAVLAVSAALPAANAANGAPPVARSVNVDELKSVPVMQLPAVDAELRLAEDAAVTEAAPLRYAVPNAVAVTPDAAGHWENLADGGRLWRYRVHVPNATDLNFGFSRYHLPRGATLYVYSEERAMYHGPFTDKDNYDHGELWLPLLAGDRAVIELYLPATYQTNAKLAAARSADPSLRGALPDRLDLELGHVGAGYRDFFGINGKPNLTRQGACNIDTVCPEGDNWRDEIRSVGQYSLGGSYFCTGTMVMDVPGSFDPWFLTANHCGLSTGNDQSLVVLWNFESPTCGQLSGGSFADTTVGGATLVSSRADVDTALLLLNNTPDESYNVYWSGWDARGAIPANSVGISHPSNDEKALAFNEDALGTVNSCIGPTGVGNTHWFVNNYEQGMTEPGSSGSGLWSTGSNDPYNPVEKHLIGVLSGGGAACAGSVPNNLSDCYGKISIAWTSGASANQRLADWLDPGAVGTLVVDGSDPDGGVGGICGDAILDSGEQCDDGNTADGDGCSSTCQVEDGFECTLPIPGGTTNGVPDGGFEGGTPNASWTEASTTFGTPICDVAGCGTGTGTGPASGAWWTWFGGIAAAETGSVEQSVVIETTDTELVFSREAIICDSANDFMRLLIDGNVEFSMNGADATCGVLGYNDVTIDLSAYNDGGAHTIRFESSIFATNGAGTNFFLDDVTIARGNSDPIPSMCTELPDACYSEDFDTPTPGLDGWTVFNNGATALDWGTSDDGFCGSVNGPAGNFAGTGVAACVDSDAAGAGVVNSYLCSPGIDLNGPVDPVLEFGYNFQVFSSTGEDAFEVLVGTAAPGLGTIGSYTSIFSISDDAGTFGGAGVSAALDVSAFSGGTAYVCYRYSGDFDWYAQVDDILVTAETCEGSAPDTDGDGVTDDVDNCILDANPLQVDSNGDNIGNVCDADIIGPGGGPDDCQINFF